jgi:hypothetical protein
MVLADERQQSHALWGQKIPRGFKTAEIDTGRRLNMLTSSKSFANTTEVLQDIAQTSDADLKGRHALSPRRNLSTSLMKS